MNDWQKDPAFDTLTDGVIRTYLPFSSWYMRQLFWAITGCKLTIVLHNLSQSYKRSIIDSWVEANPFTCAEILSLQTASGRRRCRKKLKRTLVPFLRQLRRSPQCFQLRLRIGGELEQLGNHEGSDSTEIPPKAVKHLDICEMERRRDEDFTSYSAYDVSDTFPVSPTVEPRLVGHMLPGIGNKDDYVETVRSLWWEASRYWNLIRQIRIDKNSSICGILDLDPNGKHDIEEIIDKSLDFALGKVDGDKLTHLARWSMGRMLVSRFLKYPYSEKKFVSAETPVGEDITLGDMLEDVTAQRQYSDIDSKRDWEAFCNELPATQRRIVDIYLEAKKTGMSVRKICERDGEHYEGIRKGWERIKKKYRP